MPQKVKMLKYMCEVINAVLHLWSSEMLPMS